MLSPRALKKSPDFKGTSSSITAIPNPGETALEELVHGLSSWKNIQDIVRVTFKALHSTVRLQGEAIKRIEHQLSERPTWAEVDAALAQRPTAADVGQSFSDLRASMEGLLQGHQLHSSLVDAGFLTKEDRENMVRDIQNENSRKEVGVSAEVELLVRKMIEERMSVFASREELSSKANTLDVNASLQLKANKASLDEISSRSVTRAELETVLKTRACVADVDTVLSRKIDMSAIPQMLANHVTKEEMQIAIAQCLRQQRMEFEENFRQATREDDGNLIDLAAAVKGKADAADVNILMGEKLNKSDFQTTIKELVPRTELELRLRTNTEAIAAEVKSALTTSHTEIVRVLNQKAYKVDVSRAVRDSNANVKADISALKKGKTDIKDVRSALKLKADADDVREALRVKASKEDLKALEARVAAVVKSLSFDVDEGNYSSTMLHKYGSHSSGGDLLLNESPTEAKAAASRRLLTKSKSPLLHLHEILMQKANACDISSLPELEATVAHIQEALNGIEMRLRDCAVHSEQKRIANQLETVRQLVSQELMVGRWIWKTGETTTAGMVPWNVQCANTQPESFLWQKDSDALVAVVPGLYQVSLGFFCNKNPTVHVIVNGESVLSSSTHQSSPSSVLTSTTIHRKGARIENKLGTTGLVVRRGRHSAGNVTGWTVVEFLAIPAKAKISVSYEGTRNVQGFISLKKM